jgi:hypothetical protein
MADVVKHGWTHRRRIRGGSDEIPLEVWRDIAVFAPRNALDGNLPDSAIVVSTGDGKAWFFVTEAEDGHIVVGVEAGVSEAGAVEVQLRNETQTTDLLATAVTIDSGDNTSHTAAVPVVIDDTVILATGDLIFVDVDDADGTAEGLIVTVGTGMP